MVSSQKFLLLFIVALVFGSAFIISTKPIQEGLDIQGGIRLVLEAQTTDKIKEINQTVMKSAISVVRNRVDGLGVAEPIIQQKGDKQIIVEIPSVKDPEEAIRIVGETTELKFKEQVLDTTTNQPKTEVKNGKSEFVWKETGLDGFMIKDAGSQPNGMGNSWAVNISFNSEGSKLFGDITTRLVGKPLGIELDGKIISSPNVNEPITGGTATISGNFTAKEAQELAIKLKAGQFPVPLKMVENRTVGATLGEEAVNKSMIAGALGLGAVIIFMFFNYRFPGLVADLALIIYTLLSIAIFKLVPITLTVPGIAGFILSIGMAVDANILIFERTKEELRAGRSIYNALEAGFQRAFPSIFDSNMTTLISCAVLFYFGTGLIRGFALTLGIGVLVSMFTAITVTRTFLRSLITIKRFKNPALFGIKPVARTETPATTN
ncbi:MAG: protein translocase subunit SecD [Candidatus Sericytochromatia bacterium]